MSLVFDICVKFDCICFRSWCTWLPLYTVWCMVFFSVCFCSKTNFARLCGNKHHQKGNLIMKWNLTSQDMLHNLWNTHLHEACGLIIIYFLYFQENFWLWHLALQTLPQFFQFTERVILTSRDQLHSRLLKVVVAQVQLPQVRGVGVQRWRQVSAAFLCDSAEWQPVWREGLLISSKKFNLCLFKSCR